jgi:hypothetical protein
MSIKRFLPVSLLMLLCQQAAMALPSQRQIPVSDCESGQPKIGISPFGVTVSFLQLSGERIQSLVVGDPTRVVITTDVTPQNRGSTPSVLFIRQLSRPLRRDTRLLSVAQKSGEVPLQLILFNRNGTQKRLCQFMLQLNTPSRIQRIDIIPGRPRQTVETGNSEGLLPQDQKPTRLLPYQGLTPPPEGSPTSPSSTPAVPPNARAE